MSKKYRKVKAIPGTIFDEKFGVGTPEHQRRCGLFYLKGINPAAVAANDTDVESIGDGRVRVYYMAIYVPADQNPWPTREGGPLEIPRGIECDHGGGAKDRHVVKQVRHFDANLSEVLV